MSEINLTPWRVDIEKALHLGRSEHETGYLQLATVDNNQHAAVRTLVFRGFLEDTGTLLMHTDIRSEKIADICQQPLAQLCWYFSQSREQFRLSGTLEIVSHSLNNTAENIQLHEQHWRQLSTAARNAYAWPAPGTKLGSVQQATNESTDNMSEHFALLLFNVDKVDYLQLTTSPHQRCIYTHEGDHWHKQLLNP